MNALGNTMHAKLATVKEKVKEALLTGMFLRVADNGRFNAMKGDLANVYTTGSDNDPNVRDVVLTSNILFDNLWKTRAS